MWKGVKDVRVLLPLVFFVFLETAVICNYWYVFGVLLKSAPRYVNAMRLVKCGRTTQWCLGGVLLGFIFKLLYLPLSLLHFVSAMYALPKKIKQKLPSFSKRDWWWSCESEWMSARSASAICLSLCFTRGVPTGHVWWISYSIRGALLGRPRQCSELMMLWLPWSAFLCPTIVYYILLQR